MMLLFRRTPSAPSIPPARLARFASVAGALLLAAATASAQDAKDVVNLSDGKSTQLVIDAEGWDAITGKGSPPIPWDGVRSVAYADAIEFTKAIETFNAGNHGAALAQFDELEADPKLRKIFRQQIDFSTAYAAERDGKLDEAVAAYEQVVKDYPKGRYHVRAVERIAACLLAKPDAAGALQAVERHVAEAGSDAGLAAALGLIRARMLLAQGKANEAKPLFDAAVNARGAPAWVGLEGQLGQAMTVYRDGNQTDAELRFRTLTTTPDAPTWVLAGAWNGLGDILSEDGQKKRDIDKLLDALYCYLRGSTVYAPLAGQPTDQYERSLAGSARCFDFIADLEPNKEKKTLYKERANERKALLKKEFPLSAFLEKK